MELVDAVTLVGTDDIEALVCLNEAAAAMRAENREMARELAGRAATLWLASDRPYPTMMARALAIACGATTDTDEVEALATRAKTCTLPGIGFQTLGLLGKVYPEMRPGWQPAIAELVKGVPHEHWQDWMDVLSMDEAWEGATGNQRVEPLGS